MKLFDRSGELLLEPYEPVDLVRIPYFVGTEESLRTRKRPKVSPGKSLWMLCFGALCGMLLQICFNFGDIARVALNSANAASENAQAFFLSAYPHKPDSSQYDQIDEVWRAVNKEFGGKADAPASVAHKFESKRWYSEKLHPIALGLRATWIRILSGFMKDLPIAAFSEASILEHYKSNTNNVQSNCVLVQVVDGKASFKKSFSATKHGRYSSAVYIIEEVLSDPSFRIPDATFLVMLNDGNMPIVPTFGIARHWDSWTNLIPTPLGNTRGESEGWGTPLDGWDAYIGDTLKSKRVDFPWESKMNRAVFRGALQMQTYKLGSCNVQNKGRCERATRWDQVNRGIMYKRAQTRPDLFDVAFTKLRSKSGASPLQFSGAPSVGESIPFPDLQRYKYVINVGSNQDWAERLRSLLFMNSAVIMHAAETKEFFTPLLVPWMHVIPTNLMFTDLVRNVKWAVKHDNEVQEIVVNMNKFAARYLSERAMKIYWKVALLEYATRQRLASTPQSEGEPPGEDIMKEARDA